MQNLFDKIKRSPILKGITYFLGVGVLLSFLLYQVDRGHERRELKRKELKTKSELVLEKCAGIDRILSTEESQELLGYLEINYKIGTGFKVGLSILPNTEDYAQVLVYGKAPESSPFREIKIIVGKADKNQLEKYLNLK